MNPLRGPASQDVLVHPSGKAVRMWIEPQVNEKKVRYLQKLLGISPITAAILVNRGLTHPAEAAAYLYPDARQERAWLRRFRKVRRHLFGDGRTRIRIPSSVRKRIANAAAKLRPPEALPGLLEAVAVVRQWIQEGHTILIYGDYDVDGICATAILARAISAVGGKFEFYNPDRFKEGYGLHDGVLERAYRAGYIKIIAADVGITAVEAVQRANKRGQEVIILDHHEPPEVLPPARVVVDPKIRERGYPFEGLCAAGIAFKFAQLLLGQEEAQYLIELAALATVADVVPLQGENRALVREGLRRMNQTRFPGIAALRRVAGLDESKTILAYHIAYILGPRLNALGRMASARPGVRLLLANTLEEAMPYAQKAQYWNQQRQDTEQEILEESLEQFAAQPEEERAYVAVTAGEGWHHGVVGIVASRMVEATCRPAFVLSIEREEVEPAAEGSLATKAEGRMIARGSARTVPGLNLYAALCECADLLLQFGGHEAAAGLKLPVENIPAFRARMNEIVKRELGEDGLIPRVRFDAWVKIGDITIDSLREIKLFEPCGQDNPSPRVGLRGVKVESVRFMGRDGTHLKMTVCDPAEPNQWVEVVAFYYRKPGEEAVVPHVGSLIDLVGYLEINVWNGGESPQIKLLDWRWHVSKPESPHAEIFRRVRAALL